MADRPGPRILLVRLSAIGDCVHALPLACAIREALPNAFLAWAVEGRAGDLLEGHPAINRLVRLPRKWLKSPSRVWNVRRELRRLKFDIAIDPQGLTKSSLLAWLSGAKRRIGFAGSDGRELSTWLNNVRVTPTATHVIDRNLELLAALNVRPGPARFELPETPADGAAADTMCRAVQGPQGFAVINPGAGWKSKLWCPQRFGEVARQLHTRHGLRSLVVWAGDAERAWAEQIVAGSAQGAVLAPPTSLTELAAVARRARLFLASDTGPLHIAAAVGTPCVGLFGPMPGERNGPYGSQHAILQKARLSGTSRERRNADNATMLAISVEDVLESCHELLERQPNRRCA